MTVEMLTRLRFPADVIRRVEMLVANHLRFKDVQQMRSSTLKRFLRLDGFDELLELHRLDCMASNRRLENYEFVRAKLAELAPENLRPAPLLRGSDLIAAGYRPGPRFSAMLRFAEDAQLEGRLATRDEALALIEAEFGKTPSA
jgi:poly(A) polymerase